MSGKQLWSIIVIGSGTFLSGCNGTENTSNVETSSNASEKLTSYIYVAYGNDAGISQFSTSPDGKLVPLDPPTFPLWELDGWHTDGSISSLVASEDSKFVYAATRKSIYQWSVGTDGTLTFLNPIKVEGADYGECLATFKDNLYLGNQSTIVHYKITNNGQLSLMGTYSDTGAFSIAINTNRSALFATQYSTYQYSINEDGSLLIRNPQSVESHKVFALDGSGQYAYSTGNTSFDKNMIHYEVGVNGLLRRRNAATSTVDAGGVTDVAFDNNGHMHGVCGKYIRTFSPQKDQFMSEALPPLESEEEGIRCIVSNSNKLYVVHFDAISAFDLSEIGEKAFVGKFPAGGRDCSAILEIRR